MAAARDMDIMVKPRTVYDRLRKLVNRQVIERTESGYRLPGRTAETAPTSRRRTVNIYKEIRDLISDIDNWNQLTN